MQDPLKAAVLTAMRRIGGPLARLLLETGVGAGELQALMKQAFVEAARTMSEPQEPTISRIATLTGLTRREVAALIARQPDAEPSKEYEKPRLQRVLSGWWSDADFHDATGHPLPLPLRGKKASFAALVRRYSGDPRVLTILSELHRVKAARRLPDGRIEVLTRTYAHARWDPEGLVALGEQVTNQLETLVHNLQHPSRPHFNRVIENRQLDPKYVPLLVRDISAQADTLADSLDDALNNPAATVKPGDEVKDAVRLGVALYVFESPVAIPAKSDPKPAKRPRKDR